MSFDTSFGQTPLTEQMVLIAIDPNSGQLRDRPRGSLEYAAAGAMLTDLLNAGVATIIDGDVTAGAASRTPLGDVLLREMDRVPPQSLGYWVNALTLKPFSAQQYGLESLRRRGAIAVVSSRLLGLWPTTRYRLLAVHERQRTLQKIARAVTTEGDLDPSAASLITLAASCGLIKRIVTKELRPRARLRVRQIAQEAADAHNAGSAENGAYAVAGEIFDAAWIGAHSGSGSGGGG